MVINNRSLDSKACKIINTMDFYLPFKV